MSARPLASSIVIVCTMMSTVWAANKTETMSGLPLLGDDADTCTANATITETSFDTGYNGAVTLKIPYKADQASWASFSAVFKLYVGGVQKATVTCTDYCVGKLAHDFTSSSGDTSYSVKISVSVSGDHSCSDDHTKSITFSRPQCPSTVSVNSIPSQDMLSTSVTITGTVTDDGHTSTVNSSTNTVRITVTKPGTGGQTQSPLLPVSSGSFSWNYTLPFPKVYGTYQVHASYNGDNDSHPLQTDNTTSSQNFSVRKVIYVPTPPCAAGHAVAGSGSYTAYSVLDYEDSQIYNFPVDLAVDPVDPFETISLQGLPQNSALDMSNVTTSFGLLPVERFVLTQQVDSELWFYDKTGTLVETRAVPVPNPWGLAYQGPQLWVASHDPDGPIVPVDPNTGLQIGPEIWPHIGEMTALTWDDSDSTLLALTAASDFIYRIDPGSGFVLEQLPLDSTTHRAITAYDGTIWIGDMATRAFFEHGQPLGDPGGPQGAMAYSDETSPESIELTWIDPDQQPPWDEMRIYRDTAYLDSVLPGAETYADSGLTQHQWYEYHLTAYRSEDDVEGPESDIIAAYAGGPPPRVIQVPGEYATLTEAIQEARNGDTILVAPGSYAGPVDYDARDISIESTDGPGSTVLDGLGSVVPIVYFDGEEGLAARLSGFTLTGAQTHYGGVIQVGPNAQPLIENTIITGNALWNGGGGIYVEDAAPTVRNTWIVQNVVQDGAGGGVYVDSGAPVLSGVTIADNTADLGGGGIYSPGSADPIVTNSILWNNAPNEIVLQAGAPAVSYSDVRGGYAGTGNFDIDPLFESPLDGDYHLQVCSELIEAGDPSYNPSADETDIDGEPRWSGAAIDIGADERDISGEPDQNENGVLDVCESCDTFTDCADTDGNGIRDDGCTWWACDAGLCAGTAIPFADMGGSFGACQPDGAAGANDHFHALNCFSNNSTLGTLGYPCESNPPTAFNVDAGGQFGTCCPDGVCDGNDAFHVLNSFTGDNPCACDLDGGLTFTCPCDCDGLGMDDCSEPAEDPVLCPAGPAPYGGRGTVAVGPVASAVLQLEAAESGPIRAKQSFDVDIYLETPLADLRGYQLHLRASGGDRGRLELVDIAVTRTRDRVFAGLPDWRAFNRQTAQMLAGLDSEGVETRRGAYLATFTFQASADAEGTFVIDLLADHSDSTQRTFLFPTAPGARIHVRGIKPVVVNVKPNRRGHE